MPAIPAKNKEFRHVQNIRIAGHLRPFLHEYESRQPAVEPDQIWVPGSVPPVEFKVLIAESAIFAQLHIMEFAKVVRVQLKQIRYYRLLLS